MKKRIVAKGLLSSFVQIIIYYLAINLVWFIGKIFYKPPTLYIDTFALVLSLELFGVIIIIQNVISAAVNKKWLTITMFILAIIVYIIGWGEDINSFPFSTVIFLIAGLFALTIKFFIDKQIDKKLILKNSENH